MINEIVVSSHLRRPAPYLLMKCIHPIIAQICTNKSRKSSIRKLEFLGYCEGLWHSLRMILLAVLVDLRLTSYGKQRDRQTDRHTR